MNKDVKYLVFGFCVAFVLLSAFVGVSVALASAKIQSAGDNATAIGLGGQAESKESSNPLANTLFEKKYKLALTLPPEKAVYLLPDMLSDAMPGGVIILNDTEVPETGESFEVCLLMLSHIKNVTQYIAHEAVDPNVTAYAISVEEFIETVENVAETANEFIATGEIKKLESYQVPSQVPAGPGTGLPRGLLGYQEGLVYWFPELRNKYIPHEEMAGGVVPLWGAFTVVEKVKGVKMVVVKKKLPWYRAWYRVYRIRLWSPWYEVWHLKIVPAEFVKVISLHNVYDFEEGRPKMVKTVEKQVILEEELQDFWYFLPPPS